MNNSCENLYDSHDSQVKKGVQNVNIQIESNNKLKRRLLEDLETDDLEKEKRDLAGQVTTYKLKLQKTLDQ